MECIAPGEEKSKENIKADQGVKMKRSLYYDCEHRPMRGVTVSLLEIIGKCL